MDFISVLFGAGMACLPQVLSHAFGSYKDRAARRLVHYEARLVAARRALVFYEGWADEIDRGGDPDDDPDIRGHFRDTFGERFAAEADRAMWAKDNGVSYRAIVAQIDEHIIELERKTGVPRRLT